MRAMETPEQLCNTLALHTLVEIGCLPLQLCSVNLSFELCIVCQLSWLVQKRDTLNLLK